MIHPMLNLILTKGKAMELAQVIGTDIKGYYVGSGTSAKGD